MQQFLRKYGVQTTIHFVLYEVDGVDLRVDAVDAGADCSMMKDEGVETTCDNDFADEGTGYSLVISATEMEAAEIMIYIVDSAAKVWLDEALKIETYGHASAMHAEDFSITKAAALATYDSPTKAEMDTAHALLATLAICTEGRLAELDAANLPTDIAAIPTVMVGTNNAALASVCTEARLAELAAANLPADIDTLLARITAAVALASVCTEGRLAELDAANLPASIDAIKAKTDNQPAGVPKNVAFPNFMFLMMDSSDHITPKTGRTITATISKDGAAFGPSSNSASEVSGGMYKIDWIQAEMNADIVTFKFTAAGADDRFLTLKTSS